MTKPKILHLVTGLDVGGTEMMLLRQLPLLQEKYDNSVCAIRGRGVVGQELQNHGIEVFYLDWDNIYNPMAIWRFYCVVKKIRPAILVTYLIHSDLFGRIFGKLFGIPIIICSKRGSPLQWEFLRTFDRWSRWLVSAYVAQTEIAKRHLMRQLHLPERKIRVITNGINVKDYSAAVDRFDKMHELGIEASATVITCVSHLRRGKGQACLLAAFERIADQYPGLHLLLVGEGAERGNLMRQIALYASQPRIHFVGARRDINMILKVTDIFVMPTTAEGMSNAILEAMASGLPCIVSDIPENQAVVQDNVNGLWFGNQNSQDLTNKINLLLSDPRLRARLGLNAQQTIARSYNIHAVTTQVADLFAALLPSRTVPLFQTVSLPPVARHPGAPAVSILMSVFNGAKTLNHCLASLDNQDFQDFEVICIDDGSTDSSASILRQWQTRLKQPLKIISNPANVGLTKSLNIGLKQAGGEFVARIDSDDWWEPSKLTKQHTFLQSHPDYGLLGSLHIDIRNGKKYFVRLPIENDEIKKAIFYKNPFGHSCIIVRKQLLDLVGGYDENVRYGQDFDLWFRLLPHTKMHNLNEYLCVRQADQGISVTKTKEQMIQSMRTTIKYCHLYHAPIATYLSLVRPLAVILMPQTLKHLVYAIFYPAPSQH